jgi:hypothetical protein
MRRWGAGLLACALALGCSDGNEDDTILVPRGAVPRDLGPGPGSGDGDAQNLAPTTLGVVRW